MCVWCLFPAHELKVKAVAAAAWPAMELCFLGHWAKACVFQGSDAIREISKVPPKSLWEKESTSGIPQTTGTQAGSRGPSRTPTLSCLLCPSLVPSSSH